MLQLSLQTAKDPLRAAVTQFRGGLLACAALSCMINILMLASPLFMLQVYDRILPSRSLPTLVALVGILAFVFVAAALLEMVRTRLMGRVAAGFTAALGERTLKSILTLEITSRTPFGNQPMRDLESLRTYAAGPAPGALFDAPWMPVYLLIAYLIHPLIGTLTLISGIVLLALTILNDRATIALSRQTSSGSQRSHAALESARRGVEVLRAMNFERAFANRWLPTFDAVQQGLVAMTDRSSALQSASRFLRLFLQSACLALGAALAIKGEVSAGAIIAASIIMSRTLAPVEQVTGQWSQIQAVRQAWLRLREVLLATEPTPEPMTLPAPTGRLDVEGISVVPPGASAATLMQVTFALEPGEAVAVLGPTGSGKSTLVRALVNIYAPVNGEVRFDGSRLDHWPREQLGASIGYVPQDVELLAGTVADNIARFAPDPDPQAIVRAAQRANVHDMILRLPQGYTTELGNNGAKLSAGQRQRIALARALFGQPKFLVLDEPNSNLDDAGETALGETLLQLKKDGVTVVIVTHRSSVLKLVDKVLVLRDGRQAAFGPRDELLAPFGKPATQPEPRAPVRIGRQGALHANFQAIR